MPSSLSRRVTRAFSISSRSQKRRSSVQTLESVQSICSDRDGLLSIEFPSTQCPSRTELMMENDELDFEDQAWGSPPSSNFLPRFLRKRT